MKITDIGDTDVCNMIGLCAYGDAFWLVGAKARSVEQHGYTHVQWHGKQHPLQQMKICNGLIMIFDIGPAMAR